MVRFSDVLTIVNGKNQKNVENPNGRYPIYGSGGVMGYADKYLCEAETVIIGRKGSINNPIYVKEPFWNVDTAFGLVADKTVLMPKYLYYFCVKFDFNKLNTTVTIPSLTKANLLNIEMNLPTIEEQTVIVNKLDKIANIIDIRKQQLQKLDELVKAKFVEMFGNPVSNEKNWDVILLQDVCDGIGDGLHGTPNYVEMGEYPFINGNNLIDGKIEVTDTTKFVDEAEYDKYYIELSPNAVLLSINGTLGKLALYKSEKIVLGKSACYCNLKTSINRQFIYNLMQTEAFVNFLEENATKSTIKNVGLKTIRNFSLIMPPIELQRQFSTFAQQIDKSKLHVQKSLEKLETLKKSLMQKYFG